MLGLNFAGGLRVLAASNCTDVPLRPPVKPGDAVFVPVTGVFTEGKVTRVDNLAGRVAVDYRLGKEQREGVFGFTNVATGLKSTAAR